jgi:hypothetical protein
LTPVVEVDGFFEVEDDFCCPALLLLSLLFFTLVLESLLEEEAGSSPGNSFSFFSWTDLGAVLELPEKLVTLATASTFNRVRKDSPPVSDVLFEVELLSLLPIVCSPDLTCEEEGFFFLETGAAATFAAKSSFFVAVTAVAAVFVVFEFEGPKDSELPEKAPLVFPVLVLKPLFPFFLPSMTGRQGKSVEDLTEKSLT